MTRISTDRRVGVPLEANIQQRMRDVMEAVERVEQIEGEVVIKALKSTNDLRDDLGQTGGQELYLGSGDRVPLVTDQDLRLLLGFDAATGEILAVGLLPTREAPAVIDMRLGEQYQMQEYVGSGGVVPLLCDVHYRVLLGYDIVSDRIVGAGLGTVTADARAPLELLDEQLVLQGLNHVLVYGQSLAVGAQGAPVISEYQPYSNLTFAGGPRAWDGADYSWAPLKPLAEDAVAPAPDGGSNRGETPCSGLANYATTLRAIDGHDPGDHIILASSAGHGGYSIAQLEKGTAVYSNRFLEHVAQAHAIDADHAVHVVAWLQGENDGTNEMPFATYRDKLNQLIDDINTDVIGITGQTSPVYMLVYQTAAHAATHGDIQRAQLAVAKANPRAFLATPIYHIPHHSDAVHLTAVGYKWVGAYFGRSYKTMVDGYRPQWLNPRSATLRGREIRVRFDVPTRPLVLDQSTLAPTVDNGFVVRDDDGPVVIETMRVEGDSVVLVLAVEPENPLVVRYALDHLGSGLNIRNGASGNLRDSTPEAIAITGIEYPLYHVAPHFEMSVITLGE